jgi:hypothetical protein
MKQSTKLPINGVAKRNQIALFSLCFLAFATWGVAKPIDSNQENKIEVYFWKGGGIDGQLSPVLRVVPAVGFIDCAVRELLRGPTSDEIKRGFLGYFNPEVLKGVSACGEAKPLAEYFRGVSHKGEIAIIDFQKEALCYLNATAAFQQAVKEPIELTLKKLLNVKEVKYSIDGEIYEEWDG